MSSVSCNVILTHRESHDREFLRNLHNETFKTNKDRKKWMLYFYKSRLLQNLTTWLFLCFYSSSFREWWINKYHTLFLIKRSNFLNWQKKKRRIKSLTCIALIACLFERWESSTLRTRRKTNDSRKKKKMERTSWIWNHNYWKWFIREIQKEATQSDSFLDPKNFKKKKKKKYAIKLLKITFKIFLMHFIWQTYNL